MDAKDTGFSGGVTNLQREVMERRRAGEDVELVTTRSADGGRKVEIKEVTEPAVMSMEEAVAAFSDPVATENALLDIDDVLTAAASVEATPPVSGVAAQKPSTEICSFCGHKHGDPVYAPTIADKQFFLESVLGNAPYEKAVSLLGGKLTVHCVVPERKELDAAFRLLQWCFHERKFTTTLDEKEYYTRIHAAMIVEGIAGGSISASFQRLVVEKSWTEMVSADFSALLDAVVARVGEFGKRYPFVAAAVAQFLGVYSDLVMHSLDENFWIGASRV